MARLIEREEGVLEADDTMEMVDLNDEDNLAVSPVDDEGLVEHEEVGRNAEHPSAPSDEDELPEKYKGKSMAEIVRMHQEAEKWNGRQTGELGELRRTVDGLIQAQLASQSQGVTNAAEEEEVDFFADPDKAVERAIANHPTVKAAGETATKLAKNAALMELERKHPDMAELMGSEEFGEWVGSSQFRTKLMQQAHNAYDTAAADELFTLYKERRSLVADTVNAERTQRKGAVKAASTGETRGGGAKPKGRYYRRADIINLMNTNPDKYAAMSDEIMQAYKEKRVR